MVLESTIVCVDNSEWMRNGDFLPTRIQAQQDAVSVICHAKTRQNPENNVALMTSASLEVLVTLTTDVGKLLSKLHQIKPGGNSQFETGIKIAQLALKHRQGKNHKSRIVVFVGSPLSSKEKELQKLAKKLKKEKVNVDIIALGEDVSTTETLSKFVETLNGKEGSGSHLVVVPPGPNLTEALRSSPVVQEEGVYTAPNEFGGFDVDPNLDPELALALRVSMEEQRQRQEEENKANPSTTTNNTQPSGGEKKTDTPMTAVNSTTTNPPQEIDFAAMTEEEQIALAIQMSMSESTPDIPDKPKTEETTMETDQDTDGVKAEAMEEDQDYEAAMNDPAFLQHLIGSLPGVDPNSEAIQSALQALTGNQEQDSEKNNDDSEKKEEK